MLGGVLCCDIPYIKEALEAERRLRHGDRQVYCPTCGLWRWPEQCDHPGRLTDQGFRSMVKRSEQEVKRERAKAGREWWA